MKWAAIGLLILMGLIIKVILSKRTMARKNHVVLFFTTLIGFFFFIPFIWFYKEDGYWVQIVIWNFILCLYSVVGTVSYGVNPLFPGGRVEKLTVYTDDHQVKVQTVMTKELLNQQEQELSLKMVAHHVKSLPKDMHVLTRAIYKQGSNMMTFYFIVVSKYGIYHLYPCNWGGKVYFSDAGAKKGIESPKDGPDYTIKSVYASRFIKELVEPIGMMRNNIEPIICVTNDTAVITGTPTTYRALRVDRLGDFMKEEKEEIYTRGEIEAIVAVLDAATK
jgi:hypothetical protein